jgi:hypothetical protein
MSWIESAKLSRSDDEQEKVFFATFTKTIPPRNQRKAYAFCIANDLVGKSCYESLPPDWIESQDVIIQDPLSHGLKSSILALARALQTTGGTTPSSSTKPAKTIEVIKSMLVKRDAKDKSVYSSSSSLTYKARLYLLGRNIDNQRFL